MENIIQNSNKVNLENELEKVYQKLYEANESGNFYDFYSFIRTTKIPFIPCNTKKTENVYTECFKVLHRIGEISIPVSIALSMHYYVLASLSSYPFSIKSKQYWKREILLKKIKKEKLLIANTGSIRTFKDINGNKKVTAKEIKDGYIVAGQTPYMSLAGVADYLVFTAELSQESRAVFFVKIDRKKIKFSNVAFGNAMLGSYTKTVEFKDLIVSKDDVIKLSGSDNTKSEILIYQRSWFQALVPSPYLGAAYQTIKLLRDFASQKLKNGEKLSESDSFLMDIGQLMIKYKSAMQLCEFAGRLIANYKKDETPSIKKIFEASVIAKYNSTHNAEEIVNKARHIMGSKFLAPNSLTNKIYKEIVFGVLQPMTDIDIREYFYKLIINDNET